MKMGIKQHTDRQTDRRTDRDVEHAFQEHRKQMITMIDSKFLLNFSYTWIQPQKQISLTIR